jgi:hypothetical protein
MVCCASEPAVDFQTASAAGLHRLSDSAVLAFAAESRRVLVSHDVNTMPDHFRTFVRAGRRSPGVFLIPQKLDIAEAIDELLLIWFASEAEEWEDRLEWVPL